MKRASLIAGLVATAACLESPAAPLSDNTVRLAPSQLRLPQAIGPLRYSGQSRFNDRRLGRSFGYNAAGISLSIYVYDYGIRDIPDGPDSVPLCEQFESAKREIELGGNYENVRLAAQYSRPLADDGHSEVAREALYHFERRGVRAVSALWLTAIDGYFIKLRLSLRWEVADELDEARARILAAIQEAVSNLRRRESRAAPAPLQEASIELDGQLDPLAASWWLEYAARLVTYSRTHPEILPSCGGPLRPDFAAELDARRSALERYRVDGAARRASAYFDDLLKVDDAGLLPEYVWHFLRDESTDAAPPMELRMGEFEAFRQRELADHVVQSGARVRINGVRVLPSAPPGS